MSAPNEQQPVVAPARWSAANLACRRGRAWLFEGLDVELNPGDLVWVRGRNGAGKTSLLELVAGLTTPEVGRVLCDGQPLTGAHQRRVVYIGHDEALNAELTAAEALAFLLRIHGRPSDGQTVRAALDHFGIASRADAPVRTLSQGQRRRVALARLAAEQAPSLWLLDEPFDALDPDGVQRVHALVAGHLQRQGCVLLASHQPPRAELDWWRAIDLDARTVQPT